MNDATSAKPAASLEALNAAGQGVRVEFRWQKDRFSHTVFGVRSGLAVPLLESVEGVDEDCFPPSPPWAELHQQGEAILLTGATAAGHWSMSLGIADSRFLLFDVACRLRAGDGAIQSVYKIAGANTLCSATSPGAVVASEAGYSVSVGPHGLEPSCGCQVTCDDEQAHPSRISVVPTDENPRTFPATVRWRYGVCWAVG